MIKSIALALIFAISGAATATAAMGSETAVPAPKPAKKEKPKKICRSNSQDTGSRITKRVCKTQDEWDAKEDGQEASVKSKGGAIVN